MNITVKNDSGEELEICLSETGFEFTYEGEKYSAKKGVLSKIIGEKEEKTLLDSILNPTTITTPWSIGDYTHPPFKPFSDKNPSGCPNGNSVCYCTGACGRNNQI